MEIKFLTGKICYVTDVEVLLTLPNGALVVTDDPVKMAELRLAREEYVRLLPEVSEADDD